MDIIIGKRMVSEKTKMSDRLKNSHVTPYDYQIDAVNAIAKCLKTEDRTHAVLACGTGKTLISLWVSEKIKAKRIVIFIPSLALVSQYLNEWLRENTWSNISILVICSDLNVISKKEEEITKSDYDFPITTDKTKIFKFLNSKKDSTQIIFCTYHSSRTLMSIPNQSYDFAIYDEAHRTAGYHDRQFNISLKSNVIKKRLFMTATPKQADYHNSKKASKIYSMDDASIYGPRSYTLNFTEAINRKLITDYKIIISFINGEDGEDGEDIKKIDDEFFHKSHSLIKAIRKTKSTKCITYHNSIKDATLFAQYLKKCNEFTGIDIFHINGHMNMKERNKIMNDFRKSEKSIITNSKCLTEGVDIPSIDMAAFLHSRNSKIDIVQAIGRTLRNSKNKKYGNIFLPILLDKNIKNIHDTLKSSNYSVIWNVLNTLSNSATELSDISKNISVGDLGSGTNAEGRKNNDRFIYLDSPFNNKETAELVTVNFIKMEGDQYFDIMLERLKKLHIDATISGKMVFGPYGICADKKLKKFSENIRESYRNNSLENEKILKLEKIGFQWDVKLGSFSTNLQQWIKYKEKKTTKIVSERVRKWESYIRQIYFDKSIRKDYLEQLNGVGFEFEPFNSKWNKKFIYIKDIGITNIKYSKDFDWIQRQKYLYRINKLPPDRAKKLVSIGVLFNKKETYIFSDQYEELSELRKMVNLTNQQKKRKKKIKSNLRKWLKNGNFKEQADLLTQKQRTSIFDTK